MSLGLTPVESSHIAAIGYLEDERVLLVRYKDGSLYAQIGWDSEAYGQLVASTQSVGRFLEACKNPAVLIWKGVMRTDGKPECDPETAPAGNEAPPAGALNVIDEDASKCCRKAFALVGVGGSLSDLACPECNTSFRRHMVGSVAHWRIVPLFALRRSSGQ